MQISLAPMHATRPALPLRASRLTPRPQLRLAPRAARIEPPLQPIPIPIPIPVDRVRLAAVKNPKLCPREIGKGDVLLTRYPDDAPNFWERIAHDGQVLHAPGPGRSGDHRAIHAMIAIEPGDADSSCQIAEAQLFKANKFACGKFWGGEHDVFAPKNRELGEKAAQIAQTWTKGHIRYSPCLAIHSPFGDTRFHADAKRLAKLAAEGAEHENPAWGKDGTYCSMAVTLAYQAAAIRLGVPIPKAFQIHAKYATPRVLNATLKADPEFTHIGVMSEDCELPQLVKKPDIHRALSC